MSHGLRYRDESELPPALREQIRRREAAADARAEKRKRKPRSQWNDEEHEQQVLFITRIRELAEIAPETYGMAARRTYAIPNGGGRSRTEAGRLKAEGQRKGVSDIFTSFPSHGRHGLYIEMKAKNGKVSDEQADWQAESAELGYMAAVCYSAEQAVAVWVDYVTGGHQQPR